MRALYAFAAAVVLAGCGSSPKANFYTLAGDSAPATAAGATTIVTIAPVTVPEMVDRPQVVVRSRNNQVEINEYERWAGSLKSEISRALADNLARLVPNSSVYAYPQGAVLNADYRVLVDIQRFDSVLNEAARVDAQWTVQAAKGAVRSGRSVVNEQTNGAGYEALVAAHGRAIARVSADIAAAVKSIQSSPAKP